MGKIKKFLKSLFEPLQTEERAEPVKTLPRTSQTKEKPQPITPYTPNHITLNRAKRKLDELTKYPIWEWECFRGILICLATLGAGQYIPAAKRPNCVYLDGLQNTFAELRQLSKNKQGRETSRVILVDRERSCLVISGKTRVGTSTKVRLDLAPQPGRERQQMPILTIHVHPDQSNDIGLSDLDYVSFLSDQRQIIMIICVSDSVFFAMKTSATPSVIASETIQRMISSSRQDIYSIWSSWRLPAAILAFNKAVCMEFGMTLYKTSDPKGNFARHVSVVN